jgi:aspartate aminotransferase
VTAVSPTAAGAAGDGVLVLSTGDVRLPVYPAAPPPVPAQADQPYLAPAGQPELRALIAEYATTRGSATVDPAHVLVTPGARLAILAVLAAAFAGRPGQREVLLPAPHWASYPTLIRAAGGIPVVVPGTPSDGRIDAHALDAHRTPATAAVILNSPRNPDGAVAPAAAIDELAGWAGRHGLVALFDEVYRGLPLEPTPLPSVTGLGPDLPAHCVVVDGLTKSHALAGLRVGWAIGTGELIAAAVGVASHVIGHTAGIAQAAAVAALGADPAVPRRLGPALASNRDAAVAALAGIPGVRCPPPPGGIFLFPDLRGWLATAPAAARADLAGWLRAEHRVAVVDGAAFGAPGHARLSFAVPAEQLAEGMRRLRAALTGTARTGTAEEARHSA